MRRSAKQHILVPEHVSLIYWINFYTMKNYNSQPCCINTIKLFSIVYGYPRSVYILYVNTVSLSIVATVVRSQRTLIVEFYRNITSVGCHQSINTLFYNFFLQGHLFHKGHFLSSGANILLPFIIPHHHFIFTSMKLVVG